jgi:competence protein ComEA
MSFRSFKSTLKVYFTFTNKEKIPILIFLVSCIILLFLIYYFRNENDQAKFDFSKFEKEIVAFENSLTQDSLLAERKKQESNTPTVQPQIFSTGKQETALFDFNPNHLPDSLWLRLGISIRTINIIKNFENKGGHFYKKEDVKKMYTLNEKDYKRIEDCISIPEQSKTFVKDSCYDKPFHKPTYAVLNFDLNTVTLDELKSIYGIGDAKANSILKYRTMLGGYNNKEQLLEAYGIDSALYASVGNQLEIKTRNLRTININSSNEADFKHPYISKQMIPVIFNFRKMHGNFNSIEEMKKLTLVSDELYRKLAPYLRAE